jgi:hypothetical protein
VRARKTALHRCRFFHARRIGFRQDEPDDEDEQDVYGITACATVFLRFFFILFVP